MTQPSEQALRLHQEACERGKTMYKDPSLGLWVISAWQLARRKACCGNGCRHCPWPKEAQRKAKRPNVPSWSQEFTIEQLRAIDPPGKKS